MNVVFRGDADGLVRDLLEMVGLWVVDGRHATRQEDEVIRHVGLARLHDANVLADLVNQYCDPAPLDGAE